MIGSYVKTHLFYIIIIGVGLIAGRAYIAEHDQRVLSDAAVKAAQVQVQTLQSQIVAEQAAAAQTIAAIKAKVILVKTPAQAIQAIPDVSSLPLNARPAPDGGVTVDPLPLYTELAQCKIDAVSLNACTQTSAQKDQIITAKDAEIKALRKKPSFFHRVVGTLKTVGIGVGIGLMLTHL